MLEFLFFFLSGCSAIVVLIQWVILLILYFDSALSFVKIRTKKQFVIAFIPLYLPGKWVWDKIDSPAFIKWVKSLNDQFEDEV